ncbi:MAG: ABC transporter ATP-binding protein/permease [Bacilli bacterium]|nr:ABC transporter ATP-binding protein/permease [Bacilli bacterium]
MNVETLEQLKGDKKIPTSILLRKIWKYLKKEIPSLIIALVLVIANVGFDVVFPLIIEKITNHFSNTDPTKFSLTFLGLMAGGYLALAIVGQAFLYIESIILQKAGQRIVYRLRMDVFEHIENMSQNQLNDMPVGSLVTRVANYTTSISDLFTHVLVNLVRNALTIFGVFIIMFTKSIPLSGIMSIFVVIIFIASFFFSKAIRKIFSNERKYISDLNTFLNENLSGIKIVQLFNQQKRKNEEFIVKNETLRKQRYKLTIAFGIYRPFISFLYYFAIALTFFFGMKLSLTPGSVLAFYLYLSKFFNPVQNIADQLNEIQKANAACEKLFNLLDVPSEIVDREDAIEIDQFEGRIEFKNVWFAYNPDEWILKDVSFVIEPKKTVAFVGATGAGKTTILSLIVRNYEIQKGEILIDGININNIKIKSLRKAVGQMLQDVFLFSGSIKSNITLHDESFSDEQVMEACRYVNADSFINKAEKGLDEEVIERGENLSQGQRQLLSFARTVLHQPQILILDEATANIDTETEVLIQQSLEKMKTIGTMLIVAHRLSTIQKADLIVVLQKGEVIEKGNHQELLKQKGFYYRLYQLQFNDR